MDVRTDEEDEEDEEDLGCLMVREKKRSSIS